MSISRCSSTCAARRRVVRVIPSWIALVVGVLHGAAALSADSSLSLEDAVQAAEAASPAITARRAAVDAATDAIDPAGALPDPQLIAGVDNLPITSGDAFSLTRDFMTMRRVGVMQEFPRHEKRLARTQRAQAVATREQALLTTTVLTVRESVARAWIARASAEERLQLLHSLQPSADAQIDAATSALRAGRGSAADGIAAKGAQAMLADRIAQAERDVEDAQAEFTRWLPDLADRPLGTSPPWSELGFDADTLVSQAAHHRELLMYDALESAAAADVALAQAEKRPDWSVEFAYAQRGPQFSNMVSLEFRVPLPLFASHRQDPVIASRQATLAQVAAERDDARRMHTAELRKTLATWRSARERVQRYEQELLPLAQDRAAATLAAYRGGRGDLQDALVALDAEVEQRVTYTELKNTLGQAWATLRFAFPEER
jgi:cobalt-zinc-cadmium efflux system outer membrane protein